MRREQQAGYHGVDTMRRKPQGGNNRLDTTRWIP